MLVCLLFSWLTVAHQADRIEDDNNGGEIERKKQRTSG